MIGSGVFSVRAARSEGRLVIKISAWISLAAATRRESLSKVSDGGDPYPQATSRAKCPMRPPTTALDVKCFPSEYQSLGGCNAARLTHLRDEPSNRGTEPEI
ncbi:hypothetical protein FB555_000793 [Alpinimonas psychrophila]|uniref:Uncharacterized protein n=1 Tax=Alpinimonas psychrophila TaxID=748908 RepID=A0A7W3PNR6_9MICO|nr:hypothetical protein [Alpinimonas psychrophila]